MLASADDVRFRIVNARTHETGASDWKKRTQVRKERAETRGQMSARQAVYGKRMMADQHSTRQVAYAKNQEGSPMVVIALIAGILIGTLLVAAVYERELRRMATFLREHERGSNQRMTVEAPGRGFTLLAQAANGKLDAFRDERAQSEQRHRSFQRDLASLSHDIRTPLTGAKGFLQLAQDELAELTPPEAATARHYLDSASARLDDMGVLLNQLFAYTRASDPDAQLDLHPVTVLPVLADALVGHYPSFEKRGWEPKTSFQDEAFTVDADEEALARIFDNLISNALRYGTTPLIITQKGRSISFANGVADAGSIDTERLFERFYRGDAARSTSGTGLGLSVCAKLAEAMHMQLETRVEGDTFVISLNPPPTINFPFVERERGNQA